MDKKSIRRTGTMADTIASGKRFSKGTKNKKRISSRKSHVMELRSVDKSKSKQKRVKKDWFSKLF